MKSAQKGIEMKLIKILALAIAMATMATAQNSGANGQSQGQSNSDSGCRQQNGRRRAAGNEKCGHYRPAARRQGRDGNAGQGARRQVRRGGPGRSRTRRFHQACGKDDNRPVKAQHRRWSFGKRCANSRSGSQDAPAKATDTKKTDAKKADTKKAETKKAGCHEAGNATKAPAVIAVKPRAGNQESRSNAGQATGKSLQRRKLRRWGQRPSPQKSPRLPSGVLDRTDAEIRL